MNWDITYTRKGFDCIMNGEDLAAAIVTDLSDIGAAVRINDHTLESLDGSTRVELSLDKEVLSVFDDGVLSLAIDTSLSDFNVVLIDHLSGVLDF